MPHPFDAGLLKPVCASIIKAFVSEGLTLGRAHAHELVVACFGFWTYHLARQYGTPFVSRLPRAPNYQPLHSHHLRLTTERIERLLAIDTWAAQRLAPLVLSIVRESGVAVDTLRVIYGDDRAFDRASILKSLRDPDFRPITASQGIGMGLLPWPTSVSLKDRIEAFAPEAVQYVAEGATYLWEAPSWELGQAHPALADSLTFSPNGSVRASLGLNFVLIKPEQWKYDGTINYVIFAPSLELHSAGDQKHWRVAWHRPSSFKDELNVRFGHKPLEAMVGAPISSLPRVQACPHCLTLFSEDRADLAHSCDRTVDAVTLTGLVRRLRDEGIKSATLEELHAAFALEGAALESDVLDAFLRRHRRTFGLRPHDGTWLFVGDGRQGYPPASLPAKS